MKKLRIPMIILITIFVVGCREKEVGPKRLLEDVYFEISSKLDESKEVTSNYIEELLIGFKYKYIDDSSNDSKYTHVFENKNEALEIIHSDDPTNDLNLLYTIKDNDTNTTIDYLHKNDLESDNLGFSMISNDIKKQDEILDKSSKNKEPLYDMYLRLSNHIAYNEEINIEKVRPAPSTDIIKRDVSCNIEGIGETTLEEYKVSSGLENISILYMKEKNKIYNVEYDGMKKESFSITDKSLLNDEEELEIKISYVPTNFKDQKKLIN